MDDQTIGIVGLGIMGGAMGRNLKSAGWNVVGFDADASICAERAAEGIEILANAGAVALRAPIILSSLPNPQAVIATAKEIAGSKAGQTIVIELSTLSLEDKQIFEKILSQAGHTPLDCPVSGTGAQAAAADLVVYASGDTAAIKKVRPMFADIARETFDVGGFGNGTRMKFIANLLVAVHNVVSAEALVLGMKSGLDPHQIVEVIGAGIGSSKVFGVRAPMMADNCYQPPTAHMAIANKDLKIISEFAASLDCPAPMLSATEPIYAAAMSNGLAREDPAAVCAVLENMAGLKRPKN